MAVWDSNTKWRQGHLLPEQALKDAGLHSNNDPSADIAVVISHDCDLASLPDNEPMVELIVGRKISKADGNFTFCKNVRRLHLNCTGGGASNVVELSASAKVCVPKTLLIDHEPCPDTRLTYEELVILQRWLVARYQRSAFANEFNDRLRNTGIEAGLKAITSKFGNHLRAIFFDVDAGEEIERSGESDTYELIVTLLYDTDVDPDAAEAQAEQARADIEALFALKCRNGWVWKNIELQSCEVMADRALSFRDAQSFKEWRTEHISLKASPPQPTLNYSKDRKD